MSNKSIKFSSTSDLELLDKILFYLAQLSNCLPYFRLEHHCNGAMASIFELLFYLKSNNLKDYGNNEK